MRLIDADALHEELLKMGIYPAVVRNKIKRMPTAFNTEKLDEEVMDWIRANEKCECPDDYSPEICEQYACCEHCRNEWLIRIIKKGGVGNE